jgi:hypothetical protein
MAMSVGGSRAFSAPVSAPVTPQPPQPAAQPQAAAPAAPQQPALATQGAVGTKVNTFA